MSVDAKCPLSAADREKYCLCETCLFRKTVFGGYRHTNAGNGLHRKLTGWRRKR